MSSSPSAPGHTQRPGRALSELIQVPVYWQGQPSDPYHLNHLFSKYCITAGGKAEVLDRSFSPFPPPGARIPPLCPEERIPVFFLEFAEIC